MYFGGLWLSCSRLASTERNRLLLTLSFFLRICLLMSGFYWIHDLGAWEQFIPTLIGFLLFRALILHRMKPVTTRRSPPPQQSLWS
ncbi:ATP synthase subunit I [Congregibacter variabilis]|uniref:N-ATPase subunit AtpR n=1 Tax=Congregibacter variabilis TaxID=3081200 RepID=UPI00388EAA3E